MICSNNTLLPCLHHPFDTGELCNHLAMRFGVACPGRTHSVDSYCLVWIAALLPTSALANSWILRFSRPSRRHSLLGAEYQPLEWLIVNSLSTMCKDSAKHGSCASGFVTRCRGARLCAKVGVENFANVEAKCRETHRGGQGRAPSPQYSSTD